MNNTNKPPRTVTTEELNKILKDHHLWLESDGKSGQCADLSGADLSDAILSGADLSGADLSGANLSHTILKGAGLSRALLSGANLRNADLSDAILSDAILLGADLSDAILKGAIFSGAILRNANLSHTILKGAGLSRADLRGAGLSRADLRGANLRGAMVSAPWKVVDGQLMREENATNVPAPTSSIAVPVTDHATAINSNSFLNNYVGIHNAFLNLSAEERKQVIAALNELV